jgi:hypothetical protein
VEHRDSLSRSDDVVANENIRRMADGGRRGQGVELRQGLADAEAGYPALAARRLIRPS